MIYVDDLIIASNDLEVCDQFMQYLSQCFHKKDICSLKYFLGLKLAQGSDGIFLCQRKYTLDILKECRMLGCKPSLFLMEQKHKLFFAKEPPLLEPSRYRRLVERLIYLTITMSELTCSVHIITQFMQTPIQGHWDAAMRVLRYLKSSPGQGIILP